MKKDLTNRKDIEKLVRTFYNQVALDPMLNHFFVHTSWDEHIETLTNFWENAIFYTGSYQGNPIEAHKKMHAFGQLGVEHFQRWTKLFLGTVDQLFEGEKAEIIKQRALSIATVMQIKLLQGGLPKENA